MTHPFRSAFLVLQHFLNRLAITVFILAALGLTTASLLAATGYWPWLEMNMSFGGVPLENAGQIFQLTLTAIALLLCFYLPSHARIMALENSHRRFQMNMQDVTQAYWAAHAADRAGLFHAKSEFDAIRERLSFLREHPDLETLEPQIMEIASQMSYLSRDLAEVYSDDNIDRARAFLKQRQQEVDLFNQRLSHAKAVGLSLKQWAQEVEMEESIAMSQLERLREDLRPILPELGFQEIEKDDPKLVNSVVKLPQKAAE